MNVYFCTFSGLKTRPCLDFQKAGHFPARIGAWSGKGKAPGFSVFLSRFPVCYEEAREGFGRRGETLSDIFVEKMGFLMGKFTVLVQNQEPERGSRWQFFWVSMQNN